MRHPILSPHCVYYRIGAPFPGSGSKTLSNNKYFRLAFESHMVRFDKVNCALSSAECLIFGCLHSSHAHCTKFKS